MPIIPRKGTGSIKVDRGFWETLGRTSVGWNVLGGRCPEAFTVPGNGQTCVCQVRISLQLMCEDDRSW